MGLPSIKLKLQAQFDVGINSEAEVVYALVETRKLLEITGSADAYPSLAFHCDWVLHTKMNRRGARSVLKLFDDLAEKHISRLDSSSEDAAIAKLLDISKFRSELEAFLASEHVHTNFDLLTWFRFARLYSLVIEDVPLLVEATPKPQLVNPAIHIRHLKSVVVTARKDEEMSYLVWALNYHEDPPPALSPAEFSVGFGARLVPSQAAEGDNK